jgi:hypothetical protein
MATEPANLQIYDARGRLLNTLSIVTAGTDYIEEIDLKGYEQGVYHLILMNKMVYKTFRIVKF